MVVCNDGQRDGYVEKDGHEGHTASFSCNGMELHIHDSGWRLIGRTPSVDWLVDSSVLLEIHGTGSKGNGWRSKLHVEPDSHKERSELIEGFGVCRILSLEGDMSRCVNQKIFSRFGFPDNHVCTVQN